MTIKSEIRVPDFRIRHRHRYSDDSWQRFTMKSAYTDGNGDVEPRTSILPDSLQGSVEMQNLQRFRPRLYDRKRIVFPSHSPFPNKRRRFCCVDQFDDHVENLYCGSGDDQEEEEYKDDCTMLQSKYFTYPESRRP